MAMDSGYLIPEELDFIAKKLRIHNVKVEIIDKQVRAAGEESVIGTLTKCSRNTVSGCQIVKIEGGFAKSQVKEFPAGTFRVDMVQPAANVAIYCLEPQAADGYVGWGVLDGYLN